VFPLTPGQGEGGMLLVRRTNDPSRFDARFLDRVRFVPCIGAQDDALAKQLADAFGTRTEDRVRTLGLGPAPKTGLWVEGDGWWLSTSEQTG